MEIRSISQWRPALADCVCCHVDTYIHRTEKDERAVTQADQSEAKKNFLSNYQSDYLSDDNWSDERIARCRAGSDSREIIFR